MDQAFIIFHLEVVCSANHGQSAAQVLHTFMVTAMQPIKKVGVKRRPLNSSKTVSMFALSAKLCSYFFDTLALALAMSRDGSSGGVIRMCVITEQGAERLFVPGDELPRFWEGKEVLSTHAAPILKPTPDAVPIEVEV